MGGNLETAVEDSCYQPTEPLSVEAAREEHKALLSKIQENQKVIVALENQVVDSLYGIIYDLLKEVPDNPRRKVLDLVNKSFVVK